MDKRYHEIEKLESEISQWLRGRFLKEHLLYGEMVELMLESLKPLGGEREGNVEDELALLTLACRMFNDLEGAKQLLLWGLPDQANTVVRDIIECMLLLRLFLRMPKRAKKWLIDLAQYQPGTVNAKLLELGINAKEYSLYGLLSHVGHSNLLASLSHVQEIEVGKRDILRVASFGSSSTQDTQYFIQQCFLTLFFLLYTALEEPLAELYSQYAKAEIFQTWCVNVENLRPKLVDITCEFLARPWKEAGQINHALQELVNKKLCLEKFKKRSQ